MAVTDKFPNANASLSDGTTTIPFIFTDGQGKKNERAFTASPYPRQALKTITGESKYSDLEPPYFAIPQDDFTGGRGNEDFESDTSRYFDGHWLDTGKENGVILGGRETYTTGFKNTEQAMPGSMVFQGVYNAPRRYLAVTFEASASYTTYQCEIWVKGVDSPTYDLQVELWSNHASNYPSAMLASKTITAANITSDTLSVLVSFVWTGTPAVVDGTDYWLVIDGGDSATSTRHWAIGCDAATAGKKKAAAGGWSATTYSPYYKITPTTSSFVGKFFEYKGCLYMITQQPGGSSALYINGDRGAADTNADLTNLEDGTKSWTTNEWAGDIVLITKGPGSEEIQPWRTISSNDGDTLVCSVDWIVTHTTATEYVILGSNKWTSLDANLGAFVTDVVVAGGFIWLAKGGASGDTGIHRYRYYNKSGVWTAEEEATSNAQISDKLLAVNHTDEGEILYSSTTDHALNDISIYKGKVPRGAISADEWLFYPLFEFNAGVPWKAVDVTNVTNTVDAAGYTKMVIAGAHTTGTAAAFNLATPLDIRNGQALVAEVKTEAALASGDYKWLYDDVEDLGKTWLPDKVLKEDYSTTWSPDKVFQEDNNKSLVATKVYHNDSATTTYTDLTAAYDGSVPNVSSITVLAWTSYIYIGCSQKFDEVNFNVTTVNDVASVMSMNYFDGKEWISHAISDDGTDVGGDTLKQDGSVTFLIPTGWQSGLVGGTEAYWIRIYVSENLTDPITIANIYCTSNERTLTPDYIDHINTYDGDAATHELMKLPTEDYLYVGNGTKFNKITVDVGTANDIASVMTAAYWNGSAWSAVTIVDGTNPSSPSDGDTLKEDGDITFAIPEGWKANSVNAAEAYWIRLDFSVALSTAFSINEITVTADDANAPKTYTDMVNAYDGHVATDHDLTLAVADYLYVGYGTKFNIITVDIGTANDISSVMTGSYWNGSVWTAVTIVDNTKSNSDTLKQDGTITFTIPTDWEANTVNGTETYWIRLDVATALTAMFSINEITVTRQNNITVSIPALATTGEWTTIMTDLSAPGNIPDASSIKSIGLQVAVDKGANVFHIRKLWLAQTAVDSVEETAFRMPGGRRINGLQAYAGNVDDPILNPWIFTTDAVYEMQTQNDDQIVKIPLEELGVLSSSENGLGHCVNGTYLYFNVGEKIERYFNRTLDDIGPDRDEGLPPVRSGIPRSLVSYPGRVYAAVDAGMSGTSSILALDGSAWHEVYRAPNVGSQIRNIYVQAIPGTNVDRLWLTLSKYNAAPNTMASDIVWVPVSLNPYNETDFRFTHEGHLITAYIYANLLDVQKTWKSLKVFVENVTSTRNIVVDYQTEGSSTWTEIGTFDTVPVEEIDIASTHPQAKRIRYRLRFFTEDQTETPRMKALVTEGVAFVPVKNQYSWTFAIRKTTENIDLKGAWNETLTSVAQYDKLKTWANAGTQLTLEHHSTLYDDKTVYIDPVSVSPIKIVDHQGIENHVAQLTCLEY